MTMLCETCSSESTVLDTRQRGLTTRRRRKCLTCGKRWCTIEIAEAPNKREGAPPRPGSGHPVIEFLFAEKERQNLTLHALGLRARVNWASIKNWRNQRMARLDKLDDVAHALGYEVWVRRLPGEHR